MSLLCRALISHTLRDSCPLDQWAHKCHNPNVWGNDIDDELLLYTHIHTHLIKQIKLQRLEWRRDKKSKGSLWQSSHCSPPYRDRCLGSQGHVLTRAQGFRIPSPEDLKPTFRAVQAFSPGLLSQALMKPSVQTFPGMRRGLRATLVRSAPHWGRRKKDGKWSQVMLSPGQHISAGLWGVKTWPVRSCESLAVEAGG